MWEAGEVNEKCRRRSFKLEGETHGRQAGYVSGVWFLEEGLLLWSLCLIFFRCVDLVVAGLQSLQGISM